MASQVLSGSGNASYTNNTGQNVRVVINYMANPSSMSWGPGAAALAPRGNVLAIGRNLAFSAGAINTASGAAPIAMSSNNMIMVNQPANNNIGEELTNNALPTELMLASGQVFSATCGAYNIVIIPEAG
jgi:hypothetical protein